MAELPSQERRSCERRVRRRLAECCVAGSEVGGTSCADAVRRAAAAEPASILLRVVEAASKPVVQRRSLAAHRNCCGAPRACGEVRGSSGNRSSGRCARSITEAERSAGAAAIDGSTVVRRKSIAQDSAGLRSDRLRHGVAAFLRTGVTGPTGDFFLKTIMRHTPTSGPRKAQWWPVRRRAELRGDGPAVEHLATGAPRP